MYINTTATVLQWWDSWGGNLGKIHEKSGEIQEESGKILGKSGTIQEKFWGNQGKSFLGGIVT